MTFLKSTTALEENILTLISAEDEGEFVLVTLREAGIVAELCADMTELCEKMRVRTCGALLIAQTVIGGNRGEVASQQLTRALGEQPRWSDVPVIVLSSAEKTIASKQPLLALLQLAGPDGGNVTLLDQPRDAESLAQALHAALRARRRQFAVRDLLQQRAEADEQTRQHAELLELTHDAIIVRERNGKIIYWNRGAEDLYGWSSTEALGRNSHELLQIHSKIAEVENALDRCGQWSGELQHRTRNGRIVFVDSRHQLVTQGSGAKTSVVLETNHNITASKFAGQALRENEDRLRLALEAANLGLWDFNPTTGTLIWDARCKALFGLPSNAFVDYETFLAGLHPEDRDIVNQTVQRALLPESGGEYDIEYRTVGLRDGGIERWIAAKGRAVFDENGRAIRFIGTARDITDHKRADLELERAKREAEQASKAKDQFLAALSHELRTPLTPVLLTLSAIQQEHNLPDHLRNDLDRIKRNVELEARLIDDLLDMTKITRGKIELELEETDIHQLIEHTAHMCSQTFQRRDAATVKLRLEAREHCVCGDSARLQQVLWNLFNNALKFTPAGKRIEVFTRNEHDKILIEIRDEGIGIDPEILPRLFDAFEQGNRSITRRYGGLGLGLAISKALAELHGGALFAKSDGAGKGAVFTVELLVVPAASAAESAAPSRQKNVIRPLRILLVEDHEHTLGVLVRLLARAGHDVTPAMTVAAALAAARQNDFDLLISDLGLPDGSGLDLMRELRETSRVFFGIALSGYGMDEDIRTSEAAGFDEHLTKPVDWDHLESIIARLTEPKFVSRAELESPGADKAEVVRAVRSSREVEPSIVGGA